MNPYQSPTITESKSFLPNWQWKVWLGIVVGFLIFMSTITMYGPYVMSKAVFLIESHTCDECGVPFFSSSGSTESVNCPRHTPKLD